MRIQDIPSLEKEITSYPTFAKSSKPKDYFLAAFKCVNSRIDLCDVNVKSHIAGLIGVYDSRLELIFSFSKTMPMHAVFHDASGFMKRHSK